jgi:hypothetical protein
MEIAIRTDESSIPKVYKLSRKKYNLVIEFIEVIADEKVDENSEDYKLFLGEQIKKALKARRVNSGNSLREINRTA